MVLVRFVAHLEQGKHMRHYCADRQDVPRNAQVMGSSPIPGSLGSLGCVVAVDPNDRA